MNIQPAHNAGPASGPTSISFPTQSGGTSPGALDGVRADWNVRMNVSHETGFVGGAGRLLIHNQVAEERREVVMLLPAALNDRPGRLELATAIICSAKPGIPVTAGAPLVFRNEGAKAIITIPLLQLNDWIYLDVTWTGAFAEGGMSFPGARVPLGDFHPQLAFEVTSETGQPALAPVASRYDVEVGGDLGSVVQLEHDSTGGVASRASEDGRMTMHDFKSHGGARIAAVLLPPGVVAPTPTPPPAAAAPQPTPATPAGSTRAPGSSTFVR